MQKIEAILPQHRLEDLARALCDRGMTGMTVTSVSRHSDRCQCSLSTSNVPGKNLGFPRVKVEIAVEDELRETGLELLLETVGQEHLEDLHVVPLLMCVQIRTWQGERAPKPPAKSLVISHGLRSLSAAEPAVPR